MMGYALGGHVEQVNALLDRRGAIKIAVYAYALGGHVEPVNALLDRGVSLIFAVRGYINGEHVDKARRLILQRGFPFFGLVVNDSAFNARAFLRNTQKIKHLQSFYALSYEQASLWLSSPQLREWLFSARTSKQKLSKDVICLIAAKYITNSVITQLQMRTLYDKAYDIARHRFDRKAYPHLNAKEKRLFRREPSVIRAFNQGIKRQKKLAIAFRKQLTPIQQQYQQDVTQAENDNVKPWFAKDNFLVITQTKIRCLQYFIAQLNKIADGTDDKICVFDIVSNILNPNYQITSATVLNDNNKNDSDVDDVEDFSEVIINNLSHHRNSGCFWNANVIQCAKKFKAQLEKPFIENSEGLLVMPTR